MQVELTFKLKYFPHDGKIRMTFAPEIYYDTEKLGIEITKIVQGMLEVKIEEIEPAFKGVE